jgi:apolipoprotein N-acyltransferase
MPELSRRFVKDAKADLLVNLTNDAWYGRTVAPWQHARLSQWRAIETRRTLLRVTNTGITSVINAKGEMTEALPIFAPGVLKAQVEILEGETLYVRFGDWFPWAMTFATLGLVLLRLRHNRRWRMED